MLPHSLCNSSEEKLGVSHTVTVGRLGTEACGAETAWYHFLCAYWVDMEGQVAYPGYNQASSGAGPWMAALVLLYPLLKVCQLQHPCDKCTHPKSFLGLGLVALIPALGGSRPAWSTEKTLGQASPALAPRVFLSLLTLTCRAVTGGKRDRVFNFLLPNDKATCSWQPRKCGSWTPSVNEQTACGSSGVQSSAGLAAV